MSKTHWANIQEITFIQGMRLLLWIFRMFGKWPFRIILYFIVWCYYLTNARARAASKDYLNKIQALSNRHSEKFTVFRHFMSFAESIFDKLLLWCGKYNQANIHCYGQEAINAAADKKQGGILICAHLGNLELCRVVSQQYPHLKFTLLMHTKHAKTFNAFLAELNPASQLNIMQVTEFSPQTAMLLTEKVAQGEFIVIAGDRIPVSLHPRVTWVPFLNHAAPFPIGPYLLAHLLECPVYLMFALHHKKGVDIYFEYFCERIQLIHQRRDAQLNTYASQYAERLSYYCLQTPLQWFNFYFFWELPAQDHK